jgi:uncharacterized membrane protein YheB (UPF0754 family)
MDKSLATNLIALLIVIAGLFLNGFAGELVLNTGLFALSGGITNWLAVHMLFERVPGFYGSGVIPARFEEFKSGIRHLVMTQFFNRENLENFFSKLSVGGPDAGEESALGGIIESVDLDAAFDSLVDVIMNSSFAGMLSMVGGADALQPLKEPFVAKMREFLHKVGEDPEILNKLKSDTTGSLMNNVEQIVDQRLEELTPKLVKEIIQQMIRKHLGWLVVWGGVIGGLIGLLATVMLYTGPVY